MARYTAYVESTLHIEVEAEDQDEARDKAYDIFANSESLKQDLIHDAVCEVAHKEED